MNKVEQEKAIKAIFKRPNCPRCREALTSCLSCDKTINTGYCFKYFEYGEDYYNHYCSSKCMLESEGYLIRKVKAVT